MRPGSLLGRAPSRTASPWGGGLARLSPERPGAPATSWCRSSRVTFHRRRARTPHRDGKGVRRTERGSGARTERGSGALGRGRKGGQEPLDGGKGVRSPGRDGAERRIRGSDELERGSGRKGGQEPLDGRKGGRDGKEAKSGKGVRSPWTAKGVRDGKGVRSPWTRKGFRSPCLKDRLLTPFRPDPLSARVQNGRGRRMSSIRRKSRARG